jgi:hypothetical protein
MTSLDAAPSVLRFEHQQGTRVHESIIQQNSPGHIHRPGEFELRQLGEITGFVRTEDGLYERFAQTAYNTAFDLAWVRETLLEVGWENVYSARIGDLGLPIAEPEEEGPAFVVARASEMSAVISQSGPPAPIG